MIDIIGQTEEMNVDENFEVGEVGMVKDILTRQKLDTMLDTLVDMNGSDLHIAPTEIPKFRIEGDLRELDDFKFVVRPEHSEETARSIIPPHLKDEFDERKQCDFRYETDKGRFRVNVFRELRGISMVFRAIPIHIPEAKKLGLPEEILNFTDRHDGFVLVAGATGSGKSTTLAALLNEINKKYKKRIITIEDPIEFVHKNKKSLISHRELGTHVMSFADGMKAALREDPDVILVGEMRDLETMNLAIEAALTGHLVFATVHAKGVGQTISRIVKVFPPNEQERIRISLADCLQGIVYQRLVKGKTGKRVALFEILDVSGAASNLIRSNKLQQLKSLQPSQGYISLDRYATRLFQEDLIDKKTLDSIKAEDLWGSI